MISDARGCGATCHARYQAHAVAVLRATHDTRRTVANRPPHDDSDQTHVVAVPRGCGVWRRYTRALDDARAGAVATLDDAKRAHQQHAVDATEDSSQAERHQENSSPPQQRSHLKSEPVGDLKSEPVGGLPFGRVKEVLYEDLAADCNSIFAGVAQWLGRTEPLDCKSILKESTWSMLQMTSPPLDYPGKSSFEAEVVSCRIGVGRSTTTRSVSQVGTPPLGMFECKSACGKFTIQTYAENTVCRQTHTVQHAENTAECADKHIRYNMLTGVTAEVADSQCGGNC
jgi:hypothetical protein